MKCAHRLFGAVPVEGVGKRLDEVLRRVTLLFGCLLASGFEAATFQLPSAIAGPGVDTLVHAVEPKMPVGGPPAIDHIEAAGMHLVYHSATRSLHIIGSTSEGRTARLSSSLLGLSKLFPGVETVTIERCLLEDNALIRLRELPRLTGVVITHTNVGDQDVRLLTKCAGLQAVTLHGGRITDRSIALLSHLRHLNYIALEHQHFVSKEIAAGFLHWVFPGAYIVVGDCELRPGALQQLNHWSRKDPLPSVEMGLNGKVQSSGQTRVAVDNVWINLDQRMENALVEGRPARCVAELSPSTLRIMTRFPQLKTLRIVNAIVKSDSLAALAELTKLSAIELIGCNVTDEDVSPLADCQGLERVVIQGGFITENALLIFATLPKLRFVDFRNNAFIGVEEGIRVLRRARPSIELITPGSD